MRPLRLTMQAFGSYGKAVTIDFRKADQNLFLITGDTGAGKTTIFDAVVFALYGEASSSSNKKEGVILQSQYAELNLEPYVELEFMEGEEVYTVRRVPRHLKTITRGAAKGSGTREITGSVTLSMPDGTEYPQKEANARLQELTGLTKNQFMQVAMIAQGEFMELLRAKSDDKKKIFRKLFNTEMYEDIVNELGNRKREREKEIGIIKTQCGSDASRIKLLFPAIVNEDENRERGEEISACAARLEALQKKVVDGVIAVMPELLEELKSYCTYLEEEQDKAERSYKKAAEIRDKKRDQLTEAEQLQELFFKLKEAENSLARCREQADSIEKKEQLAGKIRNAWEIKGIYERMEEALKRAENIRTELEDRRTKLPEQLKREQEAAGEEIRTRRLQEEALKEFSRISEKAEKALELFRKIKEAGKRAALCEGELEKKKKKEKADKEALQGLEKLEEELRDREEQLGGAGENLALCQGQMQEIRGMREDLKALSEIYREVKKYSEQIAKLQEEYVSVKTAYEKKQAAHEAARRDFLDAQAGFLAAELVPGSPCPVCGSVEHPSPRQIKEEHRELSREVIDGLEKQAEALRREQESLASEIKSRTDLKNARDKDFDENFQKLQEKMWEHISGLPEKFSPGQAQQFVKQWMNEVQEKEQRYRKEAEELKEIQKKRKELEQQKPGFKQQTEDSGALVREAEKALEGARAELAGYSASTDFATEEEAEKARREASQRNSQSIKIWENARANKEKWQRENTNSKALIKKYEEELPQYETEAARRREAYKALLEEKNFTERDWKEIAAVNTGSKAEVLEKEVQAFREERKKAEGQAESLQSAIKGRKAPVPEEIRAGKELAEKELKKAETRRDQIRSVYKDNKEVYEALIPRFSERQRLVSDHARIEHLYRLVSGNVSGSRMDLETYVQRYYLEKILYAANRRFQHMSAGQFELRMYDLEKAGEGKNRGLDLMVYSTVTGKEREVRTLSGGESFMAALALALGMADQIQENSAAIRLDMMFIDEGFGSLDEHSRNQAVKVLLEMAEGSRLIGIISHVTELKQEIEDQLLVTKDEEGSHIQWQIS